MFSGGRWFAYLILLSMSLALIVLGEGHVMYYTGVPIPLPWAGYFILGGSVLGLLGVNIFRGGAFDPRWEDRTGEFDQYSANPRRRHR